MERYNCTCHCGGSMFYKHLHDPSCDLFMHGEEAPQSKEAQLQAALDAEREKVKELECYRALWKRRDDELTGVLAQLATFKARVTELERDNAAMKQLFDANPSALWGQLATLQAQVKQLDRTLADVYQQRDGLQAQLRQVREDIKRVECMNEAEMPPEIWTDINGYAARTRFKGGVKYIRATLAAQDAGKERHE